MDYGDGWESGLIPACTPVRWFESSTVSTPTRGLEF